MDEKDNCKKKNLYDDKLMKREFIDAMRECTDDSDFNRIKAAIGTEYVWTKPETDELVEIAFDAMEHGRFDYLHHLRIRQFYRELLWAYKGYAFDENTKRLAKEILPIRSGDIWSFLYKENKDNKDYYENKGPTWDSEDIDIKFSAYDGLYHVNSVTTSLAFIRDGALFSRKYGMENYPEMQTPQRTDAKDQIYGIFNDIFMDMNDSRLITKRMSPYGPVTFVLDAENILHNDHYSKRITKTNPMYWNEDMSYKDKYFTTYCELFDYKRFGNGKEINNYPFKSRLEKHITLWDQDRVELTPKSLKWILVEKNNDHTISKQVRDAIKSSLEAVGLADIPVVIRRDVPEHKDIVLATSEDELWGIDYINNL